MNMHSGGVGLFGRAMHADPSVYNNCFLQSQIDTKYCLLCYTKSGIYHLPAYLAFLLNKMQFYTHITL